MIEARAAALAARESVASGCFLTLDGVDTVARVALNGEALGCGLGGGGALGSSPIVALDEVEAAVLPSIRDDV